MQCVAASIWVDRLRRADRTPARFGAARVRHHGDGRPGVHDEHLLPRDVRRPWRWRSSICRRPCTARRSMPIRPSILTVTAQPRRQVGRRSTSGDGDEGTPRSTILPQQEKRIQAAVEQGVAEGKTDVLIKAEKKVRLGDLFRICVGCVDRRGREAQLTCRDGEGRMTKIAFACPYCGKKLSAPETTPAGERRARSARPRVDGADAAKRRPHRPRLPRRRRAPQPRRPTRSC